MIVAPAEILLCTIVFIYLLKIVLLFMFTFRISFYNKGTHKESSLLSSCGLEELLFGNNTRNLREKSRQRIEKTT